MILNLSIVQRVLVAVGIGVGARLISAVVMFLLRKIGFLTARTKTTLDDEVVKLVAAPVHFAFQLAAIVFVGFYLFPELELQRWVSTSDVAWSAGFVWLAYFVKRLLVGVLEWHDQEANPNVHTDKPGTFGFLNTLISIVVWGSALALILNQFGVDVTALLAGLGIAGVAIAFALQSTLAGVFAAVYLAIDRPIRQGDYIKLEDGTEGFVDDISLRSTRIKTFAGNIVIVPNNKLANMVMTNYFLPGNEVVMSVPVGIAYEADLDNVESLTLEVAEQVLSDLEVKGTKDSFVRYKSFDESSIQMTVFLNVSAFLDQFVVRHEFIKALKKAYKKHKIEIPYPHMDLHVKK